MRLPSVQLLLASARSTAERFPFVLSAAVIATVAGILNIENPNHFLWERATATAVLGFPLLIALELWAERGTQPARRRIAAGSGGVLVLLCFFLLWPSWSQTVAWTRFWQLSAAFHLLVAFLPYAGRDEPNGFWQYNRALLLRAVTASLFSWVLWTALAIALQALDVLFNLDVPGERYPQAMVVLFFLFATWFFLGGVPRDLAGLDRSEDYPPVVKVFTQYVLLPIVTVYFAILTAYLVKVIVTWEWPSGWIGWLVSGVAAAGILALLLIYPVRERAENRWVGSYARWFWIALLPMIVMLWLAIWQRIAQYGVTERRYMLAILSVWLAAIAVYYTLRGSRRIIVIPASLCVLALVMFAGPWSPYFVSRLSQTQRLQVLLERNGILVDGTVRAATGPIDFLDRREINATLRYLIETHGTSSIEDWFGGRLAEIDTIAPGGEPSRLREGEDRVSRVVASLGVGYVGRWQRGDTEQFSYFAESRLAAVAIGGFDYAVRLDGGMADPVQVTGDVVLAYDSASVAYRLQSGEETLLEVPLRPTIEMARERARTAADRALPPDSLSLTATSGPVRLLMYVTGVSGTFTEEGPVVTSLTADVFVRLE
jgi:hypothetical protein